MYDERVGRLTNLGIYLDDIHAQRSRASRSGGKLVNRSFGLPVNINKSVNTAVALTFSGFVIHLSI